MSFSANAFNHWSYSDFNYHKKKNSPNPHGYCEDFSKEEIEKLEIVHRYGGGWNVDFYNGYAVHHMSSPIEFEYAHYKLGEKITLKRVFSIPENGWEEMVNSRAIEIVREMLTHIVEGVEGVYFHLDFVDPAMRKGTPEYSEEYIHCHETGIPFDVRYNKKTREIDVRVNFYLHFGRINWRRFEFVPDDVTA
jgi:hypothetical protein